MSETVRPPGCDHSATSFILTCLPCLQRQSAGASAIEIPARGYVEAFNRYQVLYAAARLTGWDGDAATCDAGVSQAYTDMFEAFDALHKAVHGRARPNYNAVARRFLDDAAKQK